MAEIFNFYVQDNRQIHFPKASLLEPIMQEDYKVATWRFRIPKTLNGIDMSAWAWWFVYINAKNETYSEPLTLVDDDDEPDTYCTADYSIDYGISKFPGSFSFSLEAISAEQGGEIDGEWHTKIYTHKVDKTLQGNQAQFAETESDIISALITEFQTKIRQLVGGATPLIANLKSQMTDHDAVYLYTGSEDGESNGYWYYYNGTNFVPGGVYASGITVDSTPTQGSNNAVRSGGVYDSLAGLKGVDATNAEMMHNVLSLASNFQTVPTFEQGGIDSSNGELTINAKACRSLPIAIAPNCDISINAGDSSTYRFRPVWYDANWGFISAGGARSTGKKYPAGTEVPSNAVYLRLGITRIDGAEVTPTEAVFIGYVLFNSNPLIQITEIPTIKGDIAEQDARIDSIETAIVSSTIPDYFQTQLDTKIPTIIENMNACGKDGETFVFITDTHWETNYKKSPLLIDYIFRNTKINHILHCGDVINEGEKSVMYKAMIAGIRAFQFGHADYFLPIARGNHDDNSNWATTEDVTAHEFDYNTVFSLMYKDIANRTTFITENEYTFYYDSPSSKTRFIFVDTKRNGKYIPYGQLITLMNATPADYKLIFVAHYIYNNTVFVQGARGLFAMISAFNSKTSGEYLGQPFDFSNSEGKVVCVLAGHTHADYEWDKDDAENTAGVPIIITDTDSWRNNSAVEGTVTSQCFDVVTVDYVNSIIKCVRIGRGNDRSLSFD